MSDHDHTAGAGPVTPRHAQSIPILGAPLDRRLCTHSKRCLVQRKRRAHLWAFGAAPVEVTLSVPSKPLPPPLPRRPCPIRRGPPRAAAVVTLPVRPCWDRDLALSCCYHTALAVLGRRRSRRGPPL